ncbi:MAG TPA: SufE family protein [Kineosporiaceae bacterium]|nr:SufE family protein [Kineosporiaceae bacterium]
MGEPGDVPSDLPETMAGIVEDFRSLSERDRLQLLLDFSRELPPLPRRLSEHRERMEPVPECQSPVFLLVDVGRDGRVHVYVDAPEEAPTTRGFAGILREGLDGLTASEVLAVPDDVPERLGIGGAVSLLRLRGMAGMLAGIKRQVRAKQPAA